MKAFTDVQLTKIRAEVASGFGAGDTQIKRLLATIDRRDGVIALSDRVIDECEEEIKRLEAIIRENAEGIRVCLEFLKAKEALDAFVGAA